MQAPHGLASVRVSSGTDDWDAIFGNNSPPVREVEPLPPVCPAFHFRVLVDCQPVYQRPDAESARIGVRSKGDVVRVVDFQGAWAKLGCETEGDVEKSWEGWMLQEGPEEALLEEIEDIEEGERESTKSLFRRIWKINDNVTARLRESSDRARQYLETGRVPPGSKASLPQGTRCLNAFWGLEVRFVKLGPEQEYWPQGCLELAPNHIRAGWEQVKEEARAGHWRVFAARPFEPNELIEVCPLVVVDQHESCMASMSLRMNVIETLAAPDAGPLPPASVLDHGSAKDVTGHQVLINLPLGYGMLYQQSIELWDVKVNWEPVHNFNCKMVCLDRHMYIYATRKIYAEEELILQFKRCSRTEQGTTIDFRGFTPYWRRSAPPENFAKALVAPHGPRKVRPVPGQVKFGRSQIYRDPDHDRGVFADASFARGEIVEMCPCLLLDAHGVECMKDQAVHLQAVRVKAGEREIIKREELYVLPLGYGGMYNHRPKGDGENVCWYYDETTQCLVWVAEPSDGADRIRRDTELCTDHGEAFWDKEGHQRQKLTREKLQKALAARRAQEVHRPWHEGALVQVIG